MARTLVLAGSLLLIVALAGLMIAAATEGAVNVLLVLVTLLVLALLGFGVVGALTTRPPDD
jgi:ABC-type polysaccharide/polyol phosphate export permease